MVLSLMQLPNLSIDEIGSVKKEIFYSESGKHHICYCEDCEDWFNTVLLFLTEEEEYDYVIIN